MLWWTGSPNDSSQFQNIMWWLKWKSVFQMRRFWWVCTFAQARLSLSVTVSESHVQARLAVCVPFMRAAKNIHKAAPEPFVTQQSDKYQTLLLARMRFRCHIWLQQMLWHVCTFAQAYLSLRYCTKILCVGSNDDLCPIYMSSKGSGESAPVKTTTGCSQCCVISMFTSRLWKSSIKLLKKCHFMGV